MLLSLVLAASYLSAVQANVFEGAQWLRDPRFEDGAIGAQSDHISNGTPQDLQNIHTLYRREFTLKALPAQAHLYVSGDDHFNLHLNDSFVVQGPAPGHHSAHPFFWLDVTPLLREGLNALGAHAYYHGVDDGAGASDDKRAGFILALDITYGDGSRDRIVSNDQWTCLPYLAHTSTELAGPNHRFLEHIDMRSVPLGWKRPGFDARDWQTPLIGFQDHHFVLQETPPLFHERYKPFETRKVAHDRFFYDFGQQLTGHTRIEIRGEAGQEIVVRHGEALAAPFEVRYELASGHRYEERVTLSGLNDVVTFYEYRGFRYIEILGASTAPDVTVEVRHYPFDRSAVLFASDDSHLEQIWALCRNSVQMGIQDRYLDGPARSRKQYVGNALLASRSHMWLTGDTRLLRKALADYGRELAWHEGIPASAPGHSPDELPEHALLFPLLLQQYHDFSGDTDFVATLTQESLPILFRRLAFYENGYGLLAGVPGDSLMERMAPALRDGYDVEAARKHFCAVQNLFFFGALKAAEDLEKRFGRNGKGYEAKARRVEAAFANQLADRRSKLFRDGPGARNQSVHVNGLALAFGLVDGVDTQAIITLIERKGLASDVFVSTFILQGLFQAGAPKIAYALMTGDGAHSWQAMLGAGATSAMENWRPGLHPEGSWCHAASSGPLWLLIEEVFGLRPHEPGLATVTFAPRPIPALPAMELRIPHRAGALTLRYDTEEGYMLYAPYGIAIHVEAGDDMKVNVHQEEAPRTPVLSSTAEGLSDRDRAHLLEMGWENRVGEELGVWVDVDRQHFYVLRGLDVVWDTVCATATLGTGYVAGSYQTPLGWHVIGQKFGADAPWGQVFRSRAPTSEIWQPGMDTKEDLVLTRILWLEGLEPGVNQGQDSAGRTVDSKQRYIYIHGTNGEVVLGTPSSHGCVRLGNDDVIKAFDMLPSGVKVLISERGQGQG